MGEPVVSTPRAFGIPTGSVLAPGQGDGGAPITPPSPPIPPAPTPYLGQFATRCAVNNSYNNGNGQIQAGTAHYARSAVTAPQFAFTNWTVLGLTSGASPSYAEAGLGGNTTIRASLEYPSGTFTQLTFSGSTTGTMAGGTGGTEITLFTDAATGISIPSGALFRVHSFVTVAASAGIVFQSGQNQEAASIQDTSLGEYLCAAASGLSDNTVNGTHGTNTTNARYGPYVAVANITVPSVLMVHDSRGLGAHDTISDVNSDLGNLARSVGPSYGYTKHGTGGYSLTNVTASHTGLVGIGPLLLASVA